MTKRHACSSPGRAARPARLPGLALGLLLGLLLAWSGAARAADPEILDNQRLTALVRQQAAAGRVTLVNFWATWCGPCVMEIPELMKLRQEYPEKRLAILGVSLDFDGREVSRFLARRPVNYPVYLAADDLPQVWAVTSIPKMVVFGPKGEKIKELEGLTDPKILRSIIDAALAR